MILATDVHYTENTATAAGVLLKNWDAAEASDFVTVHIPEAAEYIPGQFYKRELPCLLALLKELPAEPECIIVDGFVYLDDEEKPGLGKHLYDVLDGRIPVVGVAKSAFTSTPAECGILRGNSQNPLYVTAAGIELSAAKVLITQMHGAYRMPTMLKLADQVCRAA